MNIIATQYTLQYKSLDIYVAGCKGVCGVHCKGCHNPVSWNFNQGEEYNQQYFFKLQDKIKGFDDLIDRIMIFGGEPLDQNHEELIEFLKDIRSLHKEIWLFTRFNFNELPKEVIQLCDYIKCGAYIEELKTDDNIQFGIKLATSNQQIYKNESEELHI